MVEWHKIKAIAFDLDGTLVDSVPDLAVAVQATLLALELEPCSEEQVRGWVGNGAKKLIERAILWASNKTVDALQLADALPIFMTHYKKHLHQHSQLYQGVLEVIKALHQSGYQLAVVTNKPYEFAVPLIESFEIDDYFDVVLGGDSLAKMKPDPMPLQHLLDHWQLPNQALLMIGDSKNDIFAAKSAGIASIGLTYGYNYGEDIGLAGPDAVCEQFKDILSWLATSNNSEQ